MSDTFQIKNETDRAVYQTMTAYEAALMQAHLAAITKFSALAIQGSFVLNGTVGVAAFSVVGAENHCPLLLCATGALCAVLAACFAYLAQSKFFAIDKECHYSRVRRYFLQAQEEDQESKRQRCKNLRPYHIVWFDMALLCVAGSLVLFCFGLWYTVQAYVQA